MFYLITKVCNQCGERKIINDFYRNHHMADGFLGACKKCVVKYQQSEKGKAIRKKHNQTENRKINQKKYRLKWATDNSEKVYAQKKVKLAVERGDIQRGICFSCKSTKNVHGHHEDYNFPLEVVWFCQFCHIKIHKIMKGEIKK